MTRSVYIVGAAGTGKSTFTGQLLERIGNQMGPLSELHKTPNARGTIITLRGHELVNGMLETGLYLGCMRDSFPGTDGLDRASSITGVDWLQSGGAEAYSYVLAEGLTLCTKPFIDALAEHTELLLVHLYVDEMIQDLRFLQRGSAQNEGFVKMSGTRSDNMLTHVKKLPWAYSISCDTAEPDQWETTLGACIDWLNY